MRIAALNEMAARGAIKRDEVLVICTDCLGTFPEDEFEWRSERSAKGLTMMNDASMADGGEVTVKDVAEIVAEKLKTSQ